MLVYRLFREVFTLLIRTGHDVHVFSTLFMQNFVGLLCISMSIYIWALEAVWITTGYSLVNGG